MAARHWCLGPGAAHSSRTAEPGGGTHTGTRPAHVAVCGCESDRVSTTRSSCGRRPSVFGGGTATPDGQHLHDERAEQREVVRRLCPMGGEHARPPAVLSRALLPRDPLLTLRGGLVWQENGPQLRAAADPHQAAHRRRAGGRSSSTTRRCRGECGQLVDFALSRARSGFCVDARGRAIRRGGLNLGGWAARNAAVLEGLEHGHDAGRVGGAWHAKGDQSPLLWCAWWSSAFCCFCSFRGRGGCKICTLRTGAIVPEVATIVRGSFP